MKKIFYSHFKLAFLCIFGFIILANDNYGYSGDFVRVSLKHVTDTGDGIVQIAVIDKKGNPICDLQKGDFLLTDGSKPRDITHFENHRVGTISNQKGDNPNEEESENTLVPRRIFLLFDFSSVNEKGLLLARASALSFIEDSLLPSDEVTILSFTGRKYFRVHEFQTRDRRNISSIIESFGLQDITSTKQSGLNENTSINRKVVISDLAVWAESQESNETTNARNFIWALSSLSQAVRNVPGQKNIILYSGGIPDKINVMQAGSKYGFNIDYSMMFKELVASHVVIYPIYTGSRNERNPSPKMEGVLKEMAKATNGHYYQNIRDWATYQSEIQSVTGNYYILGYTDDLGRKGEKTEIIIKVDRPDCLVRIMADRFDPKPFNEYSDIEKKMLLIDVALAEQPLSQKPEQLNMRAFARSMTPPDNLGMVGEIQLGNLTSIIGNQTEIISIVFNGTDDIVDYRIVESDLLLYSNMKVSLFTFFSIPFGDYSCKIILRNRSTGQAAIASASVQIPGPKISGLLLFPPIIFLQDKDASNIVVEYLGGHKTTKGNEKLSQMCLMDPVQYSPYLEKIFKPGTNLWATVYCYFDKGDIKNLILSATLIDRNGGKEIPIPINILGRKQEKYDKTFFIQMNIPDVEPDTYLIQMSVADEANKLLSKIGTSIIIE